MKITATSPEELIANSPAERQAAMQQLRQTILANLPEGFTEEMSYGMIGYVVPHTIYPAGYHCDPKLPLPFLSFTSQKNFIAFYHMGLYANEALLNWFTAAYQQQVPFKLDMGKSCVRFKKPEHIPFDLIGELVSKVSVESWINTYETTFKRS